MQLASGLAVLALVVVSLVIAVRLLARWRKAGGEAELLLGTMLLLTVGLGYPAMMAATQLEGSVGRICWVVAVLLINTGFAFLFLFTQRVFRPGAAWARSLSTAGIASLAVSLGVNLHHAFTSDAPGLASAPLGASLFQIAAVSLGYGWSAFESFRYWRLMKKRVALSLANPAVCNRLLLWGTTSVVVILGILVNGAAIATGVDAFSNAAVLLLSSLTGTTQAILLLLAFLPPRTYVAWLERDTAPTA